MKAFASRFFLILLFCALTGGCENPAGPADTGYAGQWSGTTAQGRSIEFTISPDEVVTTLTLAHDFNGCSGSQTFSNLRLEIAPNVICIPAPCSPAVSSYRAFGYSTGDRGEGPSTSVNAVFLSTTRAEGTVNLRSYPGCGSAIGVPWAASRR